MQNESPVSTYLREVLGIQSFIRMGSVPERAPLVVARTTSKSKIIQFVIDHELKEEEQILVGKMMAALGVSYEVKTAETKLDAETYLVWGVQAKQELGFNPSDTFIWKEQSDSRYFLGCELSELLGASADVTSKKKQIWNELQCLKKS